MDVDDLLAKLSKLDYLSRASKMRRLLYTPFKYIFAIVFRKIVYPITRKEYSCDITLFWGDKITIALPASIDLFLLGCKTHPSELRLARFIIKHLQPGDFFVDIGSHVGYYSLLSSYCVGEKGKVISVEASANTFRLLKKNISAHPNIAAFNIALSDKDGPIEFFEFPGPYTEYNTMIPAQFENMRWFDQSKMKKESVVAIAGDKLLAEYTEEVTIIKIDVEGTENRVIHGLKNYLDRKNPFIVMEFLYDGRNNTAHREADGILRSAGYSAFLIGNNGELIILSSVDKDHTTNFDIESDNIVYHKYQS